MNLELKKAIDQISKDKGIDRAQLITTLEDAVRTSVERRYGDDLDVEVRFNEDTGEIDIYQFKIVVEEVENELTQITLAEAREHDPSVGLDDEMGFRMKIDDLGRIAAQSAKQVIIQRMRDAEQEQIYNEYKDRIGEIVSGITQRRDKGGWIINLGRTEALLPKDEQIPKEHNKRGERTQALIIDVKKTEEVRKSLFPAPTGITSQPYSAWKFRKLTTEQSKSWGLPATPAPVLKSQSSHVTGMSTR